ncbi:MAG: hypothetical protein EOP58_02520 [Sphingomonadales bacterium]|nr:MAG: hypothetical protein EOP58_02520 [Sphingomonadales bacterium]
MANNNTSLGENALGGILAAGGDNTGVGWHAGAGITTGSENVFVGAESGTDALQKPDADNSIAIGYDSFTTASNQAVFGNDQIVETILRGEVKGGPQLERLAQMWQTTDNYFLAAAGPAAEPSGIGNHGIGLRALSSVTTGITNTAFGYEALMSATTAIDNTAIGSGALRVKISGVGDTAVGKNSLLRCTTGAGNTGLGDTALEHVTTGNNNVGVGYSAGRDNTTGSDNVAVGVFAGGGNAGVATTFSRCLSIGTETMNYNVTGDDQVWIGYRAGHPSTGGQNTGVGSEAFRTITTGGGNAGLGYRVGNKITTGGANTLVGYGAGSDAAQKPDASNSTAIGYNTYTTADNQIAIGNNATVDVLIGMGGTSTRLGIGTTAPVYAVDAVGTSLAIRATRNGGSSNNSSQAASAFALTTTATTVLDGFGPAHVAFTTINGTFRNAGRISFLRHGADTSYGVALYSVNAGVGTVVPKFYQRPDGNLLITNTATGTAGGLPTTNPASTLTVEGSLALSTRAVTATTTATATDYTIRCDATSAAITVNLPAAGSCPGRIYVIKKTDNVNNVTVDPDGAETIDGAATQVLTTQYAVLRIQSNGAGWDLI